MPSASCLWPQPMPSVFGSITPPALSDHWPITLTWNVRGDSDGTVPRWIQHQECFASILAEVVSDKMADNSSWHSGWHVVRLAADIASLKTKELLGGIPASAADANVLAAAEALRLWWAGDLRSCKAQVMLKLRGHHNGDLLAWTECHFDLG
eukprot:1500009-Amphidinium_carterae.2